MKWVPDRTGRFAKRPHYNAAELDVACEAIIARFLVQRRGLVTYPIATDDLIVLLEQETEDVDIYADLSREGADIEGVTFFQPGAKPRVAIARALAEEASAGHRFRTTATHELGHVIFHNLLWPTQGPSALLFPELDIGAGAEPPRCRRGNLQPLSGVDWMEWQAGYACGAFLMPLSALMHVVGEWRSGADVSSAPWVASADGVQAIRRVAEAFDASPEAARVRMEQLGVVVAARPQMASLF